jgi:hypothetical protein
VSDDGLPALQPRLCETCGILAIPVAIAPGDEGDACDLFALARGDRTRAWCSWACWPCAPRKSPDAADLVSP